MVEQELLDLMACPLCKASLELDEEKLHCMNEECGCVYRIEEDIPIALIEEADRPCPDCGTQREWIPAEDKLSCPDCGTSFQHQRERA